jgi:hypothetical protein
MDFVPATRPVTFECLVASSSRILLGLAIATYPFGVQNPSSLERPGPAMIRPERT